LTTFIKVILYTYISPQNGFFKKLRYKFGSSTQLFLNSELALTCIIKYIPGRVPGMYIAIDRRIHKRFKKAIERLGMKLLVYEGQKELAAACEKKHVLLVIVPDSYDVSLGRFKKRIEKSRPMIVVYQNRRVPRIVGIDHDIYMWEPRALPRSVSSSVVVFNGIRLEGTARSISTYHSKKERLGSKDFISEIWKDIRGYESTHRRIDRRPPKIMARLLYDIYK
jgi:hypothetical protein